MKTENRDDARRPERSDGIVVFSVLNPSVCGGCGAEITSGRFLRMEKERPLCLECADLDHLVYLPGGDAALTRRSRRRSTLSAVVLRFSRSRKRYERQGILVELAALELAEQECLNDQEQRARERERASVARGHADAEYVQSFAGKIGERYPGCPANEADSIAQHACQRYSGRVGRSTAARQLDPAAIAMAVAAHVRHKHSEYDKLLAQGWDRDDARKAVATVVQGVLERWTAR